MATGAGALQKKDPSKAKTWLLGSLEKIPREVGWDQEGRTLYWLGRLAEQSDEKNRGERLLPKDGADLSAVLL